MNGYFDRKIGYYHAIHPSDTTFSAGIAKKSDDYDEEVIIKWKSSSITVNKNLEVSKSDFGSSGISYRTDSEVNVFVTLPNSQIIVTRGHQGQQRSSEGQLNVYVKYSGDEIVGGVCSEYGNDQNSLEIFDQWSTSQVFADFFAQIVLS